MYYGCFISKGSKKQSIVRVFYKHIFLKSAFQVFRMTDDSSEGLNRERDEGNVGGSKAKSTIYLM